MHILRATMTPEELREALLDDLEGGGLFLPTREYLGLGDPVLLLLNVGPSGEFRLSGKVAWHRRPQSWVSHLLPGIGFQPDPKEAPKMAFLREIARGTANDKRAFERIARELSVRVRLGDAWVEATTVNVSAGGMLLVVDEPVQVGDRLPCMIYTDSSAHPAECTVIVERIDVVGDVRTAGVRFLRLTPQVRRALGIPRVDSRPPEVRARDSVRPAGRSTMRPGIRSSAPPGAVSAPPDARASRDSRGAGPRQTFVFGRKRPTDK